MGAPTCKGKTKTGAQCKKKTNDPSGFCNLHQDQAPQGQDQAPQGPVTPSPQRGTRPLSRRTQPQRQLDSRSRTSSPPRTAPSVASSSVRPSAAPRLHRSSTKAAADRLAKLPEEQTLTDDDIRRLHASCTWTAFNENFYDMIPSESKKAVRTDIREIVVQVMNDGKPRMEHTIWSEIKADRFNPKLQDVKRALTFMYSGTVWPQTPITVDEEEELPYLKNAPDREHFVRYVRNIGKRQHAACVRIQQMYLSVVRADVEEKNAASDSMLPVPRTWTECVDGKKKNKYYSDTIRDRVVRLVKEELCGDPSFSAALPN